MSEDEESPDGGERVAGSGHEPTEHVGEGGPFTEGAEDSGHGSTARKVEEISGTLVQKVVPSRVMRGIFSNHV